MSGVSLECHEVTKRFGGLVAVDDVSLALHSHQITALIGPNGAGKTTLFNLIAGHIPVDHGQVVLDGRAITGFPSHKIARSGLARTFQDVRLFDTLTAAENVAIYAQDPWTGNVSGPLLRPRKLWRAGKSAMQRAMEALGYVGLGEKAGTKASELSFSEQKLVALARALAAEPTVLLLDEPASGLGHEARDYLITKVAGLAANGLTVCIVEHNMDIVREISNRIVFMAEGAVVADGPPHEVFANPKLAELYFGQLGG